MLQAELLRQEVFDPQTVTGRVVRRKRKTKQQVILQLLSKMGLAFFAFAVISVLIYVQGALMGYQLVSLKQEINRLETENKQLEYSIAKLSSLDRIEQEAKMRLGMISPENTQVMAMAVQPSESGQEAVHENKVRNPHKDVDSLAGLYQLISGVVNEMRSLKAESQG